MTDQPIHVRIVTHKVGRCAVCGMKWPCLGAQEQAIRRGQERKSANNR